MLCCCRKGRACLYLYMISTSPPINLREQGVALFLYFSLTRLSSWLTITRTCAFFVIRRNIYHICSHMYRIYKSGRPLRHILYYKNEYSCDAIRQFFLLNLKHYVYIKFYHPRSSVLSGNMTQIVYCWNIYIILLWYLLTDLW